LRSTFNTAKNASGVRQWRALPIPFRVSSAPAKAAPVAAATAAAAAAVAESPPVAVLGRRVRRTALGGDSTSAIVPGMSGPAPPPVGLSGLSAGAKARVEHLAMSSAVPHPSTLQEDSKPCNLELAMHSAAVGLVEVSSSSISSKRRLRNSSLYIHLKAPRFLKNALRLDLRSLVGLAGVKGVAGVTGSSSVLMPLVRHIGEGAEAFKPPILVRESVLPSLAAGPTGEDGLSPSAGGLPLFLEETDGMEGNDACFVRMRAGLEDLLGLAPKHEPLLLPDGLLGLAIGNVPHFGPEVEPFFSPHKLFQKPSCDSAPALR